MTWKNYGLIIFFAFIGTLATIGGTYLWQAGYDQAIADCLNSEGMLVNIWENRQKLLEKTNANH